MEWREELPVQDRVSNIEMGITKSSELIAVLPFSAIPAVLTASSKPRTGASTTQPRPSASGTGSGPRRTWDSASVSIDILIPLKADSNDQPYRDALHRVPGASVLVQLQRLGHRVQL